MSDRIRSSALLARRMSADAAAALIGPGQTVAMSGFTGAGYPKAVPRALAARIEQAHGRGEAFRVRVLTGASTAPELDGVLARAQGVELRLPYQSDPTLRARINAAVLRVPASAVFLHDHQPLVFRVRGGRAVLTPVHTGLLGGGEVEVRRGLQEGERVIVHPARTLEDGDRVRAPTDG